MSEVPGAFVFDDRGADAFAPFALTRPIGEVPFGRWSARERLERAAGVVVAGHLTRPWLAGYHEPGAPSVLSAVQIAGRRARLLWSSRALPLEPVEANGEGAANYIIGGALAGVRLGPGADAPDEAWLADPTPIPGAPEVEVVGTWLEAAWDLVSRGPERLVGDLETLSDGAATRPLPEGVHRIGDAPVVLGEGVRIEPGVLLDVRHGPIVLGDRVDVRAGARLEGPVYAGDDSRLLGGPVSVLSAGPFSYLRGEIEEVTTFGYCNKAHDGFLGHAVLGRWVNLGAMTTNSDLKNTYGTVRVGPPDATVDTGLIKLGCLVGDHAKTGIGTLLNTGTIVGAGSNLFGSEMPPKWVPAFSWGHGEHLVEYRREAFLETAATVMPRRGQPAGPDVLRWLGDVWDEARG